MKLCQCLCVCIKRYPKGAGQDFTANDKRLPLAAGDGSNKSRSGESLSSTILSASTLAGWLAGRANKQDRLGRGRHSQSSQQHPVPFPSERFHLPMLLLSQVFFFGEAIEHKLGRVSHSIEWLHRSHFTCERRLRPRDRENSLSVRFPSSFGSGAAAAATSLLVFPLP